MLFNSTDSRQGVVPLSQANVLLVDDDARNLFTLEAILNPLGQNLVRAASGEEALRRLLIQDFAVILMDVEMPGINGFETASLIRERDRQQKTPIIFLTAISTSDSQIFQGYSLGAVDYILKPFVPEILRSKVSVFVDLFNKTNQIKQQAEQLRQLEQREHERVRVQTLAQLNHSEQRFRAAFEELQVRVEQQAVVVELGQFALTSVDVSVLMEKVVEKVAATLEVEYSSILEFLPEENSLLLRYGSGWRNEHIGQASISAGRDTQAGYTLLTLSGEPVIVEDMRSERRFKAPRLLREHDVLSSISVIIQGHQHPYGVLGVHSTHEKRFTNNDIHFLQAVANIIAAAIEWKRGETERRLLLEREQSARQEAEMANRAKDEFLAMLSHELRTPMTAILGWAELLHSQTLDEQSITGALAAIHRNASLQVQLIEDLLDVSRIITGKLKLDRLTLEFQPMVESTVNALFPAAIEKGIQINCHYDHQVCLVDADPERLQQVVSNLLSNAIKFTPPGGWIDINLTAVDQRARLTIQDSGKGIELEFLPYVFERFRQGDGTITRKHSGLGIGLAIVRHIVDLHGGTVSAHSQGEGQGATFMIELPCCADPAMNECEQEFVAGAVSAEKSADGGRLKQLKVLIVDDEADTRRLLITTLLMQGAEVESAASAAEARELLNRWQPDLLISDIGMPDEDGYSLLKSLYNGSYRIPAVALTAYARLEDRERALEAGFQLHLAKPIQPAKLVELIAEFTTGLSLQYPASAALGME